MSWGGPRKDKGAMSSPEKDTPMEYIQERNRKQIRKNTQRILWRPKKLNHRIVCLRAYVPMCLCVYGRTRPLTEFAVTVQICSSAKRVNHCIWGNSGGSASPMENVRDAFPCTRSWVETEAWGWAVSHGMSTPGNRVAGASPPRDINIDTKVDIPQKLLIVVIICVHIVLWYNAVIASSSESVLWGGIRFDCDSTAVRLPFDLTALMWLWLAGQRPLMCYVTATLMTFDQQANGRRMAVESRSRRSSLLQHNSELRRTLSYWEGVR